MRIKRRIPRSEIPATAHRITKITALRDAVFYGRIKNYEVFSHTAAKLSLGVGQAADLWRRYNNIRKLRLGFGRGNLRTKFDFVARAKILGVESDEASDLYKDLVRIKASKTIRR